MAVQYPSYTGPNTRGPFRRPFLIAAEFRGPVFLARARPTDKRIPPTYAQHLRRVAKVRPSFPRNWIRSRLARRRAVLFIFPRNTTVCVSRRWQLS